MKFLLSLQAITQALSMVLTTELRNSILILSCICVVDLQVIDLYTAFALTTAFIQVHFTLLVYITDAINMLINLHYYLS